MASELYVETLKGLTSGANANKVIIPAGQTLDASAGTVVPSSDQILQVKYHRWNSEQTISSESWTDVTASSFNFTPVSTNSTILLLADVSFHVQDTSGTTAAGTWKVLVDGSAKDNPGDEYEHFVYSSSTTEANHYWRSSKQVAYSNTSTSQQTIKLQGAMYGNYTRISFNRGSNYYSYITAMEIAG